MRCLILLVRDKKQRSGRADIKPKTGHHRFPVWEAQLNRKWWTSQHRRQSCLTTKLHRINCDYNISCNRDLLSVGTPY